MFWFRFTYLSVEEQESCKGSNQGCCKSLGAWFSDVLTVAVTAVGHLVANLCSIIIFIYETKVAVDVAVNLQVPHWRLFITSICSNPEIFRIIHVNLILSTHFWVFTIAVAFTNRLPFGLDDILLKCKGAVRCCRFDACNFGLLFITAEELENKSCYCFTPSRSCVKPCAWSLTDDFTCTTVSWTKCACAISDHYVYAHIRIFTVFIFITLFKDDCGVVQREVGLKEVGFFILLFIFFFILLIIIRSYDFFFFFKFANESQLIVIVCCVVVLVSHVCVAIPTAISVLPVRSTYSTFAPWCWGCVIFMEIRSARNTALTIIIGWASMFPLIVFLLF